MILIWPAHLLSRTPPSPVAPSSALGRTERVSTSKRRHYNSGCAPPRARALALALFCAAAGCLARQARSASFAAAAGKAGSAGPLSSRAALSSRPRRPSASPSQLCGSERVNGEDAANDLASSSSSSSSSRGGAAPGGGGAPRTGWNHNPPSEGSDFWRPGTEQELASSSPSTSGGGSNSLRTGWLHNTSPRRPDATAANKASAGSVASSSSTSSPGGGGGETGPPAASPARQRLMDAMRDDFRRRLDHRIVGVAFHATGAGAAAVTEHAIRAPLRHAGVGAGEAPRSGGPGAGQTVEVFFTVVEKVGEDTEGWLRGLQGQRPGLGPRERADLYVKKAALRDAGSLCLFLQGGPGFGAPAPVAGLGLGKDSSWASAALDGGSCGYSRIVLLDQRGTGRSDPVTKQWLERNFPDLFLLDGEDEAPASVASLDEWRARDPERASRVRAAVGQVADYLSCFRCDSIVRDAELVRQALLLDPDDVAAAAASAAASGGSGAAAPRPWGGALGQSFGGFCLLSYLSSVEHPPRIALFTGGIPPMLTPLLDVYRKLWGRVKERSLRYYETYPDDVPVVKNIVRRLLDDPPSLASGGRLTARRFLQLGLRLGSSPASFAAIHAAMAGAFVPGSDGRVFSRPFLKAIEAEQGFDDHPLYYWLHEPSCYADGSFNGATDWAAHRAYEELVGHEGSEWDYARTCAEDDPRPVLWFGEHVFPWMAEDYGELRGVGLAAAADALARKADWGPLFDGDEIRERLASGRTRAAAAVYYEDMYVDFDASVLVASRGGPLERCKLYVTNEYQHSGLRDDGARLFAKLHGMATGAVRTPS